MAEFIAIEVFLMILTSGILLMRDGFYNDKMWTFLIGLITSISALFIAALVYEAMTNENIPQAIDVYRNKTTLEITYRDSIPVDTVVVFKNE